MTDDTIIDLAVYRASFVARTRQRLRRADRKQTRRRRYADNLLDLETRRARPAKPRRRYWSRPGTAGLLSNPQRSACLGSMAAAL